MNRLLCFLLLALGCFSGGAALAQNSTQDCEGAIPVCTPIYVQTIASTGTGNVVDLTAENHDCLATNERKTTWYIINVVTSGLLEFDLIPAAANDYDFAVWNVTPTGCGQNPCDIVHSSEPVRCNYSGTYANTGLSSTITTGTYEPAINAIAGESYVIVIDNFTQSTVGYTLDFTPSTVSITDTTKPVFRSVATSCGFGTDELIISMREPVTCNTLAGDGSDFYLTTSTGAPVTYTPTGATSQNCLAGGTFSSNINLRLSGILAAGNYILRAKNGTDGSTLADNCGNAQAVSDAFAFTIQPDPAPLTIIKADTPACIKTTITLRRPIRCNTVAADGSDFRLTGPDNSVLVIRATPLSCRRIAAGCQDSVDVTDTIALEFNKSIPVPGTYTLTVVAGTDSNSIIDTCGSVIAPYSFVVSDAGYIDVDNLSPLVVCNPEYITLGAHLNVPAATVLPGYHWIGNNLSDSTILFPTAYIDHSSRYVIEIMDTNLCYRRSKLDVLVPIRHPQVLSPDTAICLGDYVQLLLGGGVAYHWYPATGLSCTDCADPNASPTTNTTYYGIVYDQYGCSDTVSTTIKVNPLPIVAVNAGRDTAIIYDQSVHLYALSLGGKFYTWLPVTGLNNANIPNPIATPQIKTTYTVYVTDTNQCRAMASIDVDVNRTVPVAIPSGFTPNDDGRNDYFRITNLTFQKVVEFRVFNRWGKEVFNSNDNTGWNGIYNGQKQDAGVYQYIIRVGYPDGHTENFKGDVTLIR